MSQWKPICRVDDIPVLGSRRVARELGLRPPMNRSPISNPMHPAVQNNPVLKYPRVPSRQPIGTKKDFPYVLVTATLILLATPVLERRAVALAGRWWPGRVASSDAGWSDRNHAWR